MNGEDRIIKLDIEEAMKAAYIDYSMSVIVSRALPDVRDGLKPVHRRVLFGMSELGTTSNKPFKKSARIVGEVLGKYHPHGDSSVYEAMVRMAQPWSLRYPLVDGQGNFGSVDGDNAAAMRYTEARLRKTAEEILSDLEKNTVDMQLNFDDTIEEPTVMPTRIPNLLVNGASGIAVGMATNIAPHNLTEVINACISYIDDREITIDQLIEIVKAPDFPTGGIIYGYAGVKEAFETGRGRVMMRAKTSIEITDSGREKIIVTEIPYQVNKAELIRKTAELINEKKIDGLSNVNDESDREGMRIVYDVKRDSMANVTLNKLFKYTQLQTSFSVNNIALVNGRPKMLNLKDMIHYFVEHRHDVVIRRAKFELEKAEKRAHILEGLIIASDNIDEVVQLIKTSKSLTEAKERLIERFELSEIQSQAIVDMRLGQLTGLQQDKLHAEYDELQKIITELKELLANEQLRMDLIKEELIEVREKYGDDRRTEIVPDAEEFNPEDFYADDDMVVTISSLGYMKRTPLSDFRTQNRGGKGFKGSATRDNDFIEYMFSATMHNTMLLFTEKGKAFWLPVYQIPEGSRTSKGRALQNILRIEPDDNVKAFINLTGKLDDQEYINNHFIVLGTKRGIIKKTSLEAYSRPRQNGVNAITIKDGDILLEAKLTDGSQDIMFAAKGGKAVRFPESIVRPIGRTAAGVRAIRIDEKDEVVGMICIGSENENILVVSEHGYGKRSNIDDYRITNRGGKGVKTINITDKTGKLIAIRNVTDDDDLMIINESGITIRLAVSSLRVMGRATQGVKLINLKAGDKIAAVAKVPAAEDEDLDETESVEGIEGTESAAKTEKDVENSSEEKSVNEDE